tara:strand:- start:19 stop:690 length:672 start_codon:yes stop_codon:yes gene_type:complete
MKILAIIPARAGSKRLKNKNFRILGKKPLFMHLVDKIKNLKSISKIIISTDYKKIDETNFSKKIQIDFRKKKLANDKSTVLDTVINIAKKYEDFDYIGFFLPTCPFISVKDIKAGIKKLKNYDAVVSIMPFDDPIQIALRYNLKSKIIKPIFDHLKRNKTNSRYIEKSYKPSGGFYFVKRNLLLKKKTLYLRNICGILYSEKKYVDIDTLENFKYAEYLLNIK